MKKWLVMLSFIAIVCLLAACGQDDEQQNASEELNAEKWEEIQDKGVIVAGTSGTLVGASTYDDDNNLTGYDVEIMREVADRLGLNVEFEIMGIDSMQSAIKSDRIDVAVNDIEATDLRKEDFAFSDPYKYSYSTMVVRKEDNSGIESLEDLEDKRAGGGATTIYSQIAEHYGAEVVTYGNAPNEAYLSDVNNGNTDVVVNDYYLSKFGVASFPEFDIHLHPTLKFHPTEQAIMMDHDAETLQQKINEVLAEMREDGTLSELAIEFYEEDASQKTEEEVEEIEGLDL
ncbi:transporter substrate-binding domain-containing protein [Gracilibacillus sp. S3-1-1]|uniref:Transporter substrate-binding domain-containing protein n=1 Tax=Gracilibacillus pellucidus TaxID=3095368 RepID=A0ACC6M7T6_9BACI|nr:transporter substrate-binding domain-containing protein [Gracilibacillus sp. S3-1-1]MDX8046897.1 transporter substrate-binding domain-containing protein [Gracilibacillus sp. S3-1-1]